MMRYFIGILAAIAVIALGAWFVLSKSGASDGPAIGSADVAKFDADFESLLSTKLVSPGGAALDIDTLVGALPGAFAVEHNGAAFDEATGATTIKGLTLTHAALDGAAITIDELSTWGFDADLLSARIAGEQLDATALLAKRIDMLGVSVTGLAEAYQPLIDATIDGAQLLDTNGLERQAHIDAYDFAIERVVVDTTQLHPFAWTPLTLEQFGPVDGSVSLDDLRAMHMGQLIAAFARSYSIEAIAFENMSVDMKMTQFDAETGMKLLARRAGYRGIDRGDLESAIIQDLEFSGTTAMLNIADLAMSDAGEELGSTPLMKEFPLSGTMKLYSVTNVRLSNVFDHAARGQWPDATETDLLSLGVLVGKDFVYNLDGKPFYSLDEIRYDVSGFHGLAPTKIDIKFDNLVYHIDNLVEMFAPTQISGEKTSEEMKAIEDVMAILDTYDLAAPSIDLNMGWTWQQDEGVGEANIAYGVDGMSRLAARVNMRTPTYAEMVPHLKFTGDAPVDGGALEELFEQRFAINSASWIAEDEGGIEKILALIPEIALVVPDPDPEVQVLAAYEPETLRLMAVGGIQFAAGEVVKEAPQARPVFEGLVSLMEEGGRLEIRLDPPQPLDAELFNNIELEDLPPERRLDVLGLSVEHTSP
jgi:hypothetical protein